MAAVVQTREMFKLQVMEEGIAQDEKAVYTMRKTAEEEEEG